MQVKTQTDFNREADLKVQADKTVMAIYKSLPHHYTNALDIVATASKEVLSLIRERLADRVNEEAIRLKDRQYNKLIIGLLQQVDGRINRKTYSELNIDQKINFKGNAQSKGKKYGMLPGNWSAMFMPALALDTELCADDYSQLK